MRQRIWGPITACETSTEGSLAGLERYTGRLSWDTALLPFSCPHRRRHSGVREGLGSSKAAGLIAGLEFTRGTSDPAGLNEILRRADGWRGLSVVVGDGGVTIGFRGYLTGRQRPFVRNGHDPTASLPTATP